VTGTKTWENVMRRRAGASCALRRTAVALGVVTLCATLAGCRGDGVIESDDTTPAAGSTEGSTTNADQSTGDSGTAAYAVSAPGPLKDRLYRADVLIRSAETLPESVVRKIRAIKGVEAVEPLSVASASIEGRTLDVAAVDPATFRQFTPEASARAGFVWKRLAGGEVVVDNSVDRKLIGKGDMLKLGSREDSPTVHVGAFAPLVSKAQGLTTIPAISAVVNEKRGEQLGIPSDNALLVNTGATTPSKLKKAFQKALGGQATYDPLALELKGVADTAVLTGMSVTDAVGTFKYTDNGDGTITPEASWVHEYIRTETVPILGQVTCNKGMLPQLRGALTEIVQLGLESSIHPDEYAGCYYPRYIGRDASNGLSLHSWGIAVDLNVPGNQRGTVGEMDRRVVAIFKKWGFAWGGDWNYTDPMHFEMDRVVR
jgi:hypothetical protein